MTRAETHKMIYEAVKKKYIPFKNRITDIFRIVAKDFKCSDVTVGRVYYQQKKKDENNLS